MILCHCVKSFIDLESAHQGLSFEIPQDTVFAISKFLTLVLTIKVIRNRPSKLIS
jgi:hypothetical protein